MDDDKRHIKLLEIFHYVVGAITALGSCAPLIHFGIGIFMLCGAFDVKDTPPKFIAWFLVIFSGFIVLCGWTLAVCILIAGRKLAHYRARTYCIVVAGLECILMPFGTVLGIFTIFVLMRDSVQELFKSNQSFRP